MIGIKTHAVELASFWRQQACLAVDSWVVFMED